MLCTGENSMNDSLLSETMEIKRNQLIKLHFYVCTNMHDKNKTRHSIYLICTDNQGEVVKSQALKENLLPGEHPKIMAKGNTLNIKELSF